MNYIDYCPDLLESNAHEFIRTFEDLLKWKKIQPSSGNRDIRDVLRQFQLHIDQSTFMNPEFHDGLCLWKTVEIQAKKQGIEIPQDFRNAVADYMQHHIEGILAFGITLEEFNEQLPRVREGQAWNFKLFDHVLLAIAQVLNVHIISISDTAEPLHLNEAGLRVIIVAYSNGNSYDPVDVMTGAISTKGAVYEPKTTPKAINLVSVCISGFYSYATLHHFVLHNNKLLLTGPNNGGKSNITRAIAFVLGNFPHSPHQSVVDEIKYKGPHAPAEYSLALQFTLDNESANTLARFIVYGHLTCSIALPKEENFITANEEKIESIIKDVAKRLSTIQLVFRDVTTHLQPLVLCHPTYSSACIDDRQHMVVFDGHSFSSYITEKVGFHEEIVEKIKATLQVESGRHHSWWSTVKNFPKHEIVEEFCNKNMNGDNWKGNESPPLAEIIANLIRNSVAFLPQDHGLFGEDRHPKHLHIFTAAHSLQTIQANSLQWDSLQQFIRHMQSIDIHIKIPLTTSQAFSMFATLQEDKKAQWKKQLQKLGENEAAERLLGLILSNQKSTARIKEVLTNPEAIHDYPKYIKQLCQCLGELLEREIATDDVFNRQQPLPSTAYYTMQRNLPKFDIQFSCSDNENKTLTLGALYGAAQQFVIIFSTLFLQNFGTIVLDEPEVSLHFTSRVMLQRLLQALPEKSLVISTHAEEFITEDWLPALYHCHRFEAQSVVKSFANEIRKLFDNRVIQRSLGNEIRPLFFANKVLLVEGPNDIKLVSTLIGLASKDEYFQFHLRKCNIDPEKLCSWTFISLDSCSNAPLISKLANSLGVTWAVLLDNDAVENCAAKDMKKRYARTKPAINIIAEKYPDHYNKIKELLDAATESVQKMNGELAQAPKDQQKAVKLKYEPTILQERATLIRTYIRDKISGLYCWPGEMEEVFDSTPSAVDVLWDASTNKPTIPTEKKKKQKVDTAKCSRCPKQPLDPSWKHCPMCGKQRPKDNPQQLTEKDIKKEWICNKTSPSSLHDTWSYIPLHALEEALMLLILNENEEFIQFCKFLSSFSHRK